MGRVGPIMCICFPRDRHKQRLRRSSQRSTRAFRTSGAIPMDSIRISKVFNSQFCERNALTRVIEVSNVLCSKSGKTSPGTLHLTAHHLIFSYADVSQSELWASPVPSVPHTHTLV